MYLARMNFEEHLGRHGVTITGALPAHRRTEQGDFLLELQHFNDTVGAEAIATLVFTRLAGEIANDVVDRVYEAVGELGNNVDEHSGSAVGGFMAAQTYRRGSPGEELIVALGDAGVGLRRHLSTRYTVESDTAAITNSLSARLGVV